MTKIFNLANAGVMVKCPRNLIVPSSNHVGTKKIIFWFEFYKMHIVEKKLIASLFSEFVIHSKQQVYGMTFFSYLMQS